MTRFARRVEILIWADSKNRSQRLLLVGAPKPLRRTRCFHNLHMSAWWFLQPIRFIRVAWLGRKPYSDIGCPSGHNDQISREVSSSRVDCHSNYENGTQHPGDPSQYALHHFDVGVLLIRQGRQWTGESTESTWGNNERRLANRWYRHFK